MHAGIGGLLARQGEALGTLAYKDARLLGPVRDEPLDGLGRIHDDSALLKRGSRRRVTRPDRAAVVDRELQGDIPVRGELDVQRHRIELAALEVVGLGAGSLGFGKRERDLMDAAGPGIVVAFPYTAATPIGRRHALDGRIGQRGAGAEVLQREDRIREGNEKRGLAVGSHIERRVGADRNLRNRVLHVKPHVLVDRRAEGIVLRGRIDRKPRNQGIVLPRHAHVGRERIGSGRKRRGRDAQGACGCRHA